MTSKKKNRKATKSAAPQVPVVPIPDIAPVPTQRPDPAASIAMKRLVAALEPVAAQRSRASTTAGDPIQRAEVAVKAPAPTRRAEKSVQKAVDAVLHPGTMLRTETKRSDNVSQPAETIQPGVSEAAAVRPAAEKPVSAPSAPPPEIVAPAAEAALPAAAWMTRMPSPDLDALADNMERFVQQSTRATNAYLQPRQDRPRSESVVEDMSDAVRTLGRVAEHWLSDPTRMIETHTALTTQFMNLWAGSLQRMADPSTAAATSAEPKSADKRFADPEWHDNPVFDFVRKAYLLGTDWAFRLVEQADLDETTRHKARFYVRQLSSALSPTNFVATNPEVLRETLAQNGANLVRGMAMLAEDIRAGDGDLRIRQTDASKFELGVNMAVTPGKVVFRNELIELLQYAPTTETVLKRPLLIVPPWINKFYVLDLNPEKSFIRWAVSQGLTVFVVSWVNPDERHARKGFDAYMHDGILAALSAVEAATGEKDVATIGYCVGGTLLAITLAYMAARGDTRISSATFLTTQVDFSHAGDLKVFADETQIRAVEAQMNETGYLKGSKMAQAFNMLRPEELIWSYVVNNYLKGKEPMPFDLLAWNSDSTRMPAANHSFYMRNCYLENNLARGVMEVAGERLDLGRITIPIYNLAAREDHIAPALSVFEGSGTFGGPVRYVLAGSGHIAGVVSPPAKAKYGFWLGGEAKGSFEDWLATAVHHPGTWWTDWAAWVSTQAPARVPPRQPGDGSLAVLGDAPGTYVRVKA